MEDCYAWLFNHTRVERRAMSPPRVRHEGIKKTVVVNFADLCQSMNRRPEHVMRFLLLVLRTTGSLDSYKKLEVNGRFVPKNLEWIMKEYADNFVICKCCNSQNTSLLKDSGAVFIRCKRFRGSSWKDLDIVFVS